MNEAVMLKERCEVLQHAVCLLAETLASPASTFQPRLIREMREVSEVAVERKLADETLTVLRRAECVMSCQTWHSKLIAAMYGDRQVRPNAE